MISRHFTISVEMMHPNSSRLRRAVRRRSRWVAEDGGTSDGGGEQHHEDII
jgi:hypothetical protein